MKITVLDLNSIGNDIDFSPLSALGDCKFFPATSQDEIVDRIADTEVAIINKIKMTKEILDRAPNLKLICVAATGYDNIDTAYCREKGIGVANVPGYSTESVAMVTISIVLALMTHLNLFSDFVKNGEYTAAGVPNRLTPAFHDLSGKTWGIVGYGNIGKKIGDIARAFGCKVIYNKNSPVEDKNYRNIDDLCRESDIITLNCPLNHKTRELINADRISLMKKNVVLVNTARGAVCDEAEIARAIKEGKLAAYGCDVYSAEPFPTSHPYYEIKDMPNVCLTPHMAWASFEARSRVVLEMAENIKAFAKGTLRNRVEL